VLKRERVFSAMLYGHPWATIMAGTRTDYSVDPWDYSTCVTRHLLAWSARITEVYSVRKLHMYGSM
jgi:hypothetical protein